MAKAKGLIKISGKYGDHVFVHSKKYGDTIRKAPAEGSKKRDPALMRQYSRTSFLNDLASELNKTMGSYFGTFKSSDFYQRVQKCFRREPLNNRFLLLLQLKEFELNPAYPMRKLGYFAISAQATAKAITAQLTTILHPQVGTYRADCYYYELLLICWDKDGKLLTIDWQLSDWISLADGLPQFEFSFAQPTGTQHWLLCLRQQLGIQQQDVEAFAAQAIQIVDAGSFDKGDKDILAQRALEAAELKSKQPTAKQGVREMGRVKARGN